MTLPTNPAELEEQNEGVVYDKPKGPVMERPAPLAPRDSLAPPPVQGPPVSGPIVPPSDQFPRDLMESLASNAPGWTDEQMTALEFGIRASFPDIDDGLYRDVVGMVQRNADPTIVDQTWQEFNRQVNLSTVDLFDEATINAITGYVSDERAFNDAVIDTFLANGGALRTASEVFAKAEKNKQWVTAHWLENNENRDLIEQQVRDEGDRYGVFTGNPAVNVTGQLDGLRGKSVGWAVNDGELAMTFTDDEGDGGSFDVLISLDEGTNIRTSVDALTEYLLATNGRGHHVMPTSDEVPGRRSWLGALIKETDDVVKWVEDHGASAIVEQVKDEVARAAAPIPAVNEREEERAVESAREKETLDAVRASVKDQTIVAITRQFANDNPDLTMSQAVTAGIGAFNSMPEEITESMVAESVADLQAAAEAKAQRTSMLGQFIDEDVAPPVLDALAAWDGAIHFLGIVVSDFTNMDASAQAIKALMDGDMETFAKEVGSAILPTTPDMDSIMREVQNAREEGLPKAFDAYVESVQDIGDIATFYGIDPDSNWAAWVNTAASIGFDPLTYATMGGNAQWSALRRGVTTIEGAERLMRSRTMKSVANNLVKNVDVRPVSLLAEGNLSSTAIRRLVKIGATEYRDKAAKVAAMDEVLDILKSELPANGGMWIPNSSARAMRRKTTTGLSRAARWLSMNPGDTKTRTFLQDTLLRVSKNRHVRINDRDFLDEVMHIFEVRRLSDADAMADDILRAVDAYDLYRSGDDGAAMLQGRLQVLRQEVQDLAVAHAPDEIKQVPKLRRWLGEWDDSVKELQARIAAEQDDATRRALQRQMDQAMENRAQIQAMLDDTNDAYNARVKTVAEKRKEITHVERTLDDLGAAGRDRSVLEEFIHSYMDEWADELGVPKITDADGNELAHHFFPSLPRRDWSVVTGRTGSPRNFDESVDLLAPFGEEASKNMAALGMRARRGVTPLAVSPHELHAWATMTRTQTGKRVWDSFQKHPGIKKFFDGVQTVWASSVLLNPRTALRSHLDEIVRFYEQAGASTDVLKALQSMVKDPTVGSEARAFARNEMDNILAMGAVEYQLVSPAQRGMWVHAERWINGTILRDPIFRAYARVQGIADDVARRAEWEKWWNNEGVHLAKKSTMSGKPITGQNSYDIIHDAFEGWLGGMKAPSTKNGLTRDQVRERLISAAANAESANMPAAVWRQLPEVPAQATTTTGKGFRHIADNAFQFGYGAPQSRRGSVFFDHYYEKAYDIYRTSHEGKIIDANWLVANGYADDMVRAQEIMDQGSRSSVVRELINESGMVLDDDLRIAAMRWAGQVSDDMMYTFGAASMFGSKMARVYPFGRAQVDYLQWWWRKLTQPTQFVTGHQMPGVNLRLMDRMAHLANLTNPELHDQNRPGALTPAGIVNNFTFLPTEFSSQILVDTTMSAGALPSWAIEAPFVPDEVRDVWYQVNPANAIFADTYSSNVDWAMGFIDSVFPEGTTSIRGEVETAYRAALYGLAARMHNYDPSQPLDADEQRRINATVNGLAIGSVGGAWRNDYIALDQSGWLNDNAFTAIPDDTAPSSDMMTDWALRNEQATVASLREPVEDFLGKMAGAPVYGGSDYSYVESLYNVGDYLSGWVGSGSISDAKRDSIALSLEKVLSGESTPSDRMQFADEVLETMFHLLSDDELTEFLALNPGAHINLVSFSEVKPQLIPEDVAPYIRDGKIDVASPSIARELRNRGREEGWLVYRDANEFRYDTLTSTHRTFRSYLDVIYERATGYGISARSVDVDGERTSITNLPTTLTPEWWAEHKDWLDKAGFEMPARYSSLLDAGEEVTVAMDKFREAFTDTKSNFMYTFAASNEMQAKLNRIGVDDGDMTALGRTAVAELGLPNAVPLGLSHFGRDLYEDFNAAVSAGEKYHGWGGLDEWETDRFSVTTLEDGEPVTTTYDLNDLRTRFSAAIALSAEDTNEQGNNFQQFTLTDYENSIYGRQLGDLDWVPPQVPRDITETRAHYTAPDPSLLRVVDGDTIAVPNDDGSETYMRIIGLNAPEQRQDGYGDALWNLSKVIESAETVQFAVWDPEIYGSHTVSTTREDGVIVHRDRPLVWLYVDGVPLYDPSEFSRDNVRGVRTGGKVYDYEALLSANRSGER